MAKFKFTSVLNDLLSINITLSMYLLCSICISMLNGVWLLDSLMRTHCKTFNFFFNSNPKCTNAKINIYILEASV